MLNRGCAQQPSSGFKGFFPLLPQLLALSCVPEQASGPSPLKPVLGPGDVEKVAQVTQGGLPSARPVPSDVGGCRAGDRMPPSSEWAAQSTRAVTRLLPWLRRSFSSSSHRTSRSTAAYFPLFALPLLTLLSRSGARRTPRWSSASPPRRRRSSDARPGSARRSLAQHTAQPGSDEAPSCEAPPFPSALLHPSPAQPPWGTHWCGYRVQ